MSNAEYTYEGPLAMRARPEQATVNPDYDRPKGYAGSRDETPTYLSVAGAINLTANDMHQLREEFEELRARLSVVLKDQDHKSQGRPMAPAGCKMAAEILTIHAEIQNLREAITLTLNQLDL